MSKTGLVSCCEFDRNRFANRIVVSELSAGVGCEKADEDGRCKRYADCYTKPQDELTRQILCETDRHEGCYYLLNIREGEK